MKNKSLFPLWDLNVHSFIKKTTTTKLNLIYPRMLCTKFGWNWQSGSGEEHFKILSMYFSLFHYYLSLEKTGPFIWTHLNPFYSRMLCSKSGWNWPSDFWDFIYLLFCYYLPLVKSGSFIWTNLNTLHKGFFVPSFVKIGQVVLEKKSKIRKIYRWADMQTDDRWSGKLS